MALLNVATQALTLDHNAESADVVISSSASVNTKINNSGVYAGFGVLATVTNASDNTGCQSATGVAPFIPTATKTKIDTGPVLRVNDQAIVPVTGLRGNQSCTFDVTVTIDDAGQNNTKAE